MIKKFLGVMLLTLFTMSVVVSCGENEPVKENEQEQPVNPDPEKPEPENPEPENPEPENPEPENPDPKPETPAHTPVDIYKRVPTPIVAYQDKVIASKDGVSVEVTKIENRNFVFNLVPGESVQSYRLDVYPLAHLYNSLYERMKSEGRNTLEAREVDTYIRDLIFNATGSGGFTFDPASHSDYAKKEFDWMNTSYSQIRVVPDSEYIIIVIACYDKEGTDDGEMSLCYVKTTSQPLVGNPRVNVNVKTNYTAMDITYEPNSDCKYLYQWCSNEADLMPYINTYGEKLYIDFMRHTVIGDPISANDTDSTHFYIDFGQDANASVPLMATAIALDENFTPAKSMDSKVFTLKEKPVVEPAQCKIEIIENRCGASYSWFKLTTEANTPYMFYKFLTVEQAEHYKTKATAEELKGFAITLNNDGYGFKNEAYSYNETTGKYGNSFSSEELHYLTPDTEYVIAYVGRNRVQELADVQFTPVFKTKALVTDNPAACQSTAELTLQASGRTAVTINVKYDIANHAGIRFQYIEPLIDNSVQPDANASRETYLSFLGFGMSGDAEGLVSNNWAADKGGIDTFTLPGFSPGMKIKYAYMCEDWNGVVGELKFAEVTLPGIAAGDDVTVAITGTHNPRTGSVTFSYTANDQTARMLYLAGDESMDNDALGIKHLGDENYYTAEEMIKKWTTYCNAQGLTTDNTVATLDQPANRVVIALAIAYSQNDVRSTLAYCIWDGKSFKTLKDYYPNYNPAQATISAAAAPTLLLPQPRKATRAWECK
jgi:hypothetical protein